MNAVREKLGDVTPPGGASGPPIYLSGDYALMIVRNTGQAMGWCLVGLQETDGAWRVTGYIGRTNMQSLLQDGSSASMKELASSRSRFTPDSGSDYGALGGLPIDLVSTALRDPRWRDYGF